MEENRENQKNLPRKSCFSKVWSRVRTWLYRNPRALG